MEPSETVRMARKWKPPTAPKSKLANTSSFRCFRCFCPSIWAQAAPLATCWPFRPAFSFDTSVAATFEFSCRLVSVWPPSRYEDLVPPPVNSVQDEGKPNRLNHEPRAAGLDLHTEFPRPRKQGAVQCSPVQSSKFRPNAFWPMLWMLLQTCCTRQNENDQWPESMQQHTTSADSTVRLLF